MRLDELKPAPGSKSKRTIVGRGPGSGLGAQCGKGMKGQRSRAGVSGLVGFEGGQIPLIRRIPKRGFRHSAFRIPQVVVNVSDLAKHFAAQSTVTPKALEEVGLMKGASRVKILGDGELAHSLTVQAHAFSQSARAKIEKAGGRIEVLKR